MNNTPHKSLLILLLSPLLFLVLFVFAFGRPSLWAQGNAWPKIGEIRPASSQLPSVTSPLHVEKERIENQRVENQHVENQRVENQPAHGLSARQPYSLTLRTSVGLNRHECGQHAMINVPANTVVVICYFVTNVGSESIELHSVDDKHRGRIVTKQPFSLGPGISALITTTKMLTETTIHTGSWHGLDAEGAVLASASSSAKSYVGSLVVEAGVKQPNGDCWWVNDISVPANTALNFCYRLVNQSDLSLSQHALTRSLQRSLTGASTGASTEEIALSLDNVLSPGDSITFQDLGLMLSDLVTATSTYTLVWGAETTTVPAELREEVFENPVPLSAIVPLTARVPGLAGRLTVGLERDACAETTELSVFAGTEIVLCYSVKNVGGVTFTQHTITDNLVPAPQPSDGSDQVDDLPMKRIVRNGEIFQMAPTIAGQFTEAQIVDQSAVVTMTWVAYSDNPVSGTVQQQPSPSTLTFPLPYVSATATGQISITVLPLANVSLALYEDSNQNGEQDEGELPIPNATIQLTATTEAPTEAVTSLDGIATFADLRPAVYEITVDFGQTPYFYEAADGNISSLFLRSGENEGVTLGYIQAGRRPQAIYLPVHLQAQ